MTIAEEYGRAVNEVKEITKRFRPNIFTLNIVAVLHKELHVRNENQLSKELFLTMENDAETMEGYFHMMRFAYRIDPDVKLLNAMIDL